MPVEHTTLGQFLIEESRRDSGVVGDFQALVNDIARACRSIAARVARGAIDGALGATEGKNVQGETQHGLDVLANDAFLRACESRGYLSGMVSEEMELPYAIPRPYAKGRYLLTFDPLDGSSNIDVNVSIGSIFSILRAHQEGIDAKPADFLRRGAEQVCAGYAIYGPAVMLVITIGTGVHGFTLQPDLGEFVLTHPHIRVPEATSEFAINVSNSRYWEPAVKRYVDECLAGGAGPRGRDFNMRWIASLVAEAHRILMRGGVFLYPRDTKDLTKPGRLRLLYEANPIAFIIEQAGGAASSGQARILDIVPESLHQRIGLIFGAREEVERIAAYHAQHRGQFESNYPLFGSRGLFRATT
jgi:fructose-1,6-bisphosphatase I/sedoheptulose-1,7-bisphosphatase